MRLSGPTRVIVFCGDYKCAHSVVLDGRALAGRSAVVGSRAALRVSSLWPPRRRCQATLSAALAAAAYLSAMISNACRKSSSTQSSACSRQKRSHSRKPLSLPSCFPEPKNWEAWLRQNRCKLLILLGALGEIRTPDPRNRKTWSAHRLCLVLQDISRRLNFRLGLFLGFHAFHPGPQIGKGGVGVEFRGRAGLGVPQ